MGPCVAGGAYLPALSDVILMGEKTSFMGLGGPNLVKGATGQTVGAEELTTHHWFDLSAAKRDLGYTPRVKTAEGLLRLKQGDSP